MTFSLWDALRYFQGGDKKKKPAFGSDKEAYDFCRNLYKNSGGVTPELRRAYEFYLKNFDDGCAREVRPQDNKDIAA
jgi:hypothetical protein